MREVSGDVMIEYRSAVRGTLSPPEGSYEIAERKSEILSLLH